MKINVQNKYSQIILGGVDNLIEHNIQAELRDFLSVLLDGYMHMKRYRTIDVRCTKCSFKATRPDTIKKCEVCFSEDIVKKRKWDGKIHYIDKKLKFLTGFLPDVVSLCESRGYSVELIDDRRFINIPENIVTDINVWHLRPFMVKDMKTFMSTNVKGMTYLRGIYKAATNAGKNSFIASLSLTFKTTTLLLVHRKELFNQAYDFFGECGLEVSRFGLGNYELGEFTVAMIRTLNNRSKKVHVKKYLQSVNVLIVDECHRAKASEYKKVISQTDANVRAFVSGTPLDTDDKGALDILGMSGPIFEEVTNEFLISKKYSLKLDVLIFDYNDTVSNNESYEEQHYRLKFSHSRMQLIKKVCLQSDMQTVIFVEHVDHGEFIYKNLIDIDSLVEFVQGSDDDRDGKLNRFASKKTRILITTMIMKEGVNIPCIECGINALGGKSTTTIKQIIGRVLRDDGINDKVYWVDFNDKGSILSKHTEKRVELYKKEGFDVFFS